MKKIDFNLKSRDYLDSPEGKRWFNQRLFSAIADEYDWMKKVLSFGCDSSWKRQLVRQLPALDNPACLDLACGNGDIALLLADKYPGARIMGLDISEPMLVKARARFVSGSDVCFVNGDIMRTGFSDACFDLITVGYGLRNAPDLQGAMEEIARILKPGGMLAVLDFSRWNNRIIQNFELMLLCFWCGLWGLIRSGNMDTYAYISHSLARYPNSKQLRRLYSEFGFRIISSFSHFGGITETVIAIKEEALE